MSIQLWSFKNVGEFAHTNTTPNAGDPKRICRVGFGWPLEISFWGIYLKFSESGVATIFKVLLTYGPNLGCIFEKPFGTIFSPEMSIPTPMFSKQWQPSCCADRQGNQLNGVSTLVASISFSALHFGKMLTCSKISLYFHIFESFQLPDPFCDLRTRATSNLQNAKMSWKWWLWAGSWAK